MSRPSGWIVEVTVRAPLKSPGAPSRPRAVERRFWDEIANGLLPREAADAAGVALAVGQRWFRHAGGMTSYSWPAPSGRYLSHAEREEIAILKALGQGVREIAAAIGRSPSTISRELRRNATTRGGKLDYRASVAQWKAEMYARRPRGRPGAAAALANRRRPQPLLGTQPPDTSFADDLAGALELVSQEPVAELRVVAVGVDQPVDQIGVLQLALTDRLGQPGVVRLPRVAQHPAGQPHRDPLGGQVTNQRTTHCGSDPAAK